jgi:hypothetical protein
LAGMMPNGIEPGARMPAAIGKIVQPMSTPSGASG